MTELEAIQLNEDWGFWGRPSQFMPQDLEWMYWLFLAGRGAGKTRSGAEAIRQMVKDGHGRIGLIAPTAADARDVMVEGESGVLSVCSKNDRDATGNLTGFPEYEPSKRQLTWANGAIAKLYSAEEPERLRGPQHSALWCDELAAWKKLKMTWDMAMFGLRLGVRPVVLITTTPKPLRLLRDLIKNPKTRITRGSTYDNASNLAPTFLEEVEKQYAGTNLGRQELMGDLLDQSEGALWSLSDIEKRRWLNKLPKFERVVVAIDPAASSKKDSNETGIIGAGVTAKAHTGIVLQDSSGTYKPATWAKKAIAMYNNLEADCIVAEANNGGEMVKNTITSINSNVPVKLVHASRGKKTRAEPVQALYEQGRVFHHGALADLEDQMVNWEPLSGNDSPDRLDAMVWAITELMIKTRKKPALQGTYGNQA